MAMEPTESMKKNMHLKKNKHLKMKIQNQTMWVKTMKNKKLAMVRCLSSLREAPIRRSRILSLSQETLKRPP